MENRVKSQIIIAATATRECLVLNGFSGVRLIVNRPKYHARKIL